MKRNGKASVGLHALAHLVRRESPVTSKDLATCLQTNPVVIRRVLGDLKKAGIVDSEKGHGGGWVVAKPPGQIHFSDVFKALGERLVPEAPQLDNDEPCLIMKTLTLIMSDVLSEAETRLDSRLQQISIDDISKTGQQR